MNIDMKIWSNIGDNANGCVVFAIKIALNYTELQIFCINKSQTDATINYYKYLLFNSILLPLNTNCESLMKLYRIKQIPKEHN